MAGEDQAGTYSSAAVGATIKTVYVERQVKAYAFLETEVDTLSYLNMQATIFYSVGAGLFSLALGIWTGALFADTLTPEGMIASKFVAPLLCILAAVFLKLARGAMQKRQKTITEVGKESVSKTE